MLISVVTAVFNRVGTVGQALQSVREQSYQPVESIVQDGASTDGTVALIKGLEFSELDLISEQDGGIYDAINRGISRANGDVIGLLHSDDYFADTYVLEKVAAAFADPTVDGVYGDLDYVSESDTSKIVRRWRSGTYDRKKLKQGWMPPHPTVYLRREVFDKFGLYDTSYRIGADYDAMLRYLWAGNLNMTYIPHVMVKMRVGGASNATLRHILKKSREDYRSIRNNGVGGLGTLLQKNTSKIRQFIPKRDFTQ